MNAKICDPISPDRTPTWWKHIPPSTPYFFNIDICTYCNGSCWYCPHSLMPEYHLMTPDVVDRVIEGLRGFPDKIKVIRYCGFGEILLHPRVLSIFKRVRDTGAADKIELITNGTRITEKLAKELPKYLDRIIISQNGLEPVKSLPVLFDRRGDCIIRIKTIGEDVDTPDKLAEFYSRFGDLCDEIFVDNLVAQWPEFDAVPHKLTGRYHQPVLPHRACAQIFKGFLVLPDGRAVACCIDWKAANVIGDVNKSSLLDIWNGEKLRKLRMAHLMGRKPELPFCRNCRANDYCDVDSLDGHEEDVIRRING